MMEEQFLRDVVFQNWSVDIVTCNVIKEVLMTAM